ncbi:potassium transporter KtrAB, KtrA subunit [Campylobacter iguaniorum]|uniref:Potassium transporter KtrAB, KtrA subunit n=1 Tax=Campylobacter iguaniorum TaxID=1244531 RepID=A0A076FCM7_9BACT|nr:TrkA family potassium uptake protein [Campylobacter iguaniorum]AII15368.1 potassium transporter KtrAB, KtrA subunit [Campylobacter iguaniorum]
MKTYAVIGLGKFGSQVALDLLQNEEQVIAIDKNEDKLKEFKNICENLFIIDTTDILSLKEAGINEVDTAIVSIGENIEASILTVMALKEIGVKEIMAKAHSQIHGKILSKIGTDRVIYPERDAANRLVKGITTNPKVELIDITNTMKIIKYKIPSKYANITIEEFSNQTIPNINIIALKRDDEWKNSVNNSLVLCKGDVILLLGNVAQTQKFLLNLA